MPEAASGGLGFAGINQGPPEEGVKPAEKRGCVAPLRRELGAMSSQSSPAQQLGKRGRAACASTMPVWETDEPIPGAAHRPPRQTSPKSGDAARAIWFSNHPIVELQTASLAKLGVGLVPFAEPEQGGSERDVGKGHRSGRSRITSRKIVAGLRRLAAAQQAPWRQAAQGHAAAGTNTRRHVEVPDRLPGTTRDQELSVRGRR